MSLTYVLVDFDNVKPSAADIVLARDDKVRLALVRGPQQTRYEADLAEALHGMGDQVTFTRCAKAGKNAADMQIAYHLGELVASMPAGSYRSTRFVVISRDKDFDPLLMYLQGIGFDASRAPSFKEAFGGKLTKLPVKAAKARATKAPAATTPAKTAKAKDTVSKSRTKKAPEAKPASAVAPAARKKSAHVAARTPSKKPAAPDPIARVIEGLQRKGDERPGKRKGLERFIESHLGRNLAAGQLDTLLAQLQRDGVLVFHDNKVEYRLPKARK